MGKVLDYNIPHSCGPEPKAWPKENSAWPGTFEEYKTYVGNKHPRSFSLFQSVRKKFKEEKDVEKLLAWFSEPRNERACSRARIFKDALTHHPMAPWV